MKCKDVERMIMDLSEENLGKDQMEEIQRHVSGCARCARLEGELREIRIHLQKIPSLIPSEKFFEHTRRLCHAKLNAPSVPKFIWGAFATLLVLTSVLMLPLARELMQDQPLSFPTLSILILMVQNLVMLFFAPVLIQRFRIRKKDFTNGFMSSGPHQA